MKLTVIRESCKGHGTCVETAPQLFELDDTGTAVLRVGEIADGDTQLARKAMFSCPEGAIITSMAP